MDNKITKLQNDFTPTPNDKLSEEEKKAFDNGQYRDWMGVLMHEVVEDKESPTGKKVALRFHFYETKSERQGDKMRMIPTAGYQLDQNLPLDAKLHENIMTLVSGLNASITNWFYQKKLKGEEPKSYKTDENN